MYLIAIGDVFQYHSIVLSLIVVIQHKGTTSKSDPEKLAVWSLELLL